jgi:hypothetical protein
MYRPLSIWGKTNEIHTDWIRVYWRNDFTKVIVMARVVLRYKQRYDLPSVTHTCNIILAKIEILEKIAKVEGGACNILQRHCTYLMYGGVIPHKFILPFEHGCNELFVDGSAKRPFFPAKSRHIHSHSIHLI